MSQDEEKNNLDRIAKGAFLLALTVALFTYGVAVGKYKLFPYAHISALMQQVGAASSELTSDFYKFKSRNPKAKSFHDSKRTAPGLRLVTRSGGDSGMLLEIIDPDFNVIHQWEADWYALWPEAEHVPEDLLPKTSRGAYVHGAVVMPNGDVIFNFEHLGLICLDVDGEVRWRLPYRTHHSVSYGPEGNVWVSGQKRANTPQPSLPHREPPYDEYTLLKVSPDGELLHEYSVQGLLNKNGYHGVIASIPKGGLQSRAYDDRLHLNDVEPFPAGLDAGYFGPGDVVVSLRNPGIIFVFNTEDERIKFYNSGMLVRQHDPDFIDGDKLMVFDNRPREQHGTAADPVGSRIVTLSAEESDTLEVLYEGGVDGPFYTEIMGKQQLLPNGNLLITESRNGRAFEVTPDGEIVWQYVNKVNEKESSLVTEVSLLPKNVSQFFQNR